MSLVMDLISKKRIYFDGGTGTCLQARGLMPGEKPESWSITKPHIIEELHRMYFEAGANIVKTNTFGVNKDKFPDYKEIIQASIECARRAADGKEDRFVAFDMGPTGRMLKPFGDMDFEYCVELYAENVKAAKGADVILIETMNDALETKAAVIAAKENSELPVFVTNVYDASGKLMTGADPISMIAMLEGLGVDAIGMNCSYGPDKMLDIISVFQRYASVPIIVNPNAGLPVIANGQTVYTMNEQSFAESMVHLAEGGATILGGCCGTTPEYIKAMVNATKDMPYSLPDYKTDTLVSSYTHAVAIGDKPVLIGERINPTGKKKLKEAIKTGDMDYILSEAVRQQEKGVHILDVNVGVPGICEKEVMKNTVSQLQAVTDTPLQIDSTDKDALESAMRIYSGKPMINSVNGKEESLEEILPLAAKYGGVLVALTLDEEGIPDTPEGRMKIAHRIIDRASEYGIDAKNIVVDPLALTVSSDDRSALITLETIKKLTDEGINTVLGVSNISFGLPNRDAVNSAFFAQALKMGLKCAIMNPFSQGMMNTYYAHNVLSGNDPSCKEYITYCSDDSPAPASIEKSTGLTEAIIRGLKDIAVTSCAVCLETKEPMDIINNMIIPALNKIGRDFEEGRAYLPQLLMSADAAAAAFDTVKEKIGKSTANIDSTMILATVKGDIHDIGKNIVKVVMESYGYGVIDLGRDVDPMRIADCVEETGCRVVGLSALMTTTVPAMEETIALLKERFPDVKTVVGGAVLTEEYAKVIGADYYAKDAMENIRIVEQIFM